MINLGIRLIVDKENNKSYISIEGDMEKATMKEREDIRDTLSEAFSKILGVTEEKENKGAIPEIINDFKKNNKSEITRQAIEEVVEEDKGNHKNTEKQEEEEGEGNHKKQKWEIEFLCKDSVTLNIGKHRNYTPYQVIVNFKDKGIEELLRVKAFCEKNIEQSPEFYQDRIKAIDEAMNAYNQKMVAC